MSVDVYWGRERVQQGKKKSLFVSVLSLGNVEFDFSGKPDLNCPAEGTEDV